MLKWMIAGTLLAGSLAPGMLAAQSPDAKLQNVLQQMDAASARFRSAEADFRWDFLEKVVNDTTSQTGSIYFLRGKTGLEMGAEVVTPARKVLSYRGGALDVYDDAAKQTRHLTAGDNRETYESFLTLGFGGSGKDLERVWQVRYLGEESLADGNTKVNCAKLDLVARDPRVTRMFTHITIWVDTARDLSLKQQFFTPEGDERTAFYSHIRLNTPVNLKRYTLPKH